MDITKTVRYRHLGENPRATIVIDAQDLLTTETDRAGRARGGWVRMEVEGAYAGPVS